MPLTFRFRQGLVPPPVSSHVTTIRKSMRDPPPPLPPLFFFLALLSSSQFAPYSFPFILYVPPSSRELSLARESMLVRLMGTRGRLAKTSASVPRQLARDNQPTKFDTKEQTYKSSTN